MKKTIYSILLLLVATVGLSSCIDNFDEDEKYVYPAKAPALGAYGYTDATGEGDNYTLNIAVNAEGDTIVTTQMLWGDGTAITTVGIVTEYDPVSGTLVAEGQSEYGYYLWGSLAPAKIYASWNAAHNKLSVSVSLYAGNNIYDVQYYLGAGSFNASKLAMPLDICGDFSSTDDNVYLQLFGADENIKAQLGLDDFAGKIGIVYVGENQDLVTYEYDAATGELEVQSLLTGDTYEIAFNDKAQLFAKIGGENVLLQQVL